MVDTMRSRSELLALYADNVAGDISPQDQRDGVVSWDDTGWSDYADTQYPNAASPFSVLADTDTAIPNNKASVNETQKPSDVTTFYDGTVITGRNGDGILITVDMKAKPTNANATTLEIWFDIGGAVGELYRRILTFPKGNGVERPINFTVSGYTLDTWEANGATVYCRCNGTVDLYGIRYVITRTHRGSRRS